MRGGSALTDCFQCYTHNVGETGPSCNLPGCARLTDQWATGGRTWTTRHVAVMVFCKIMIPVNITFTCTKHSWHVIIKANHFSFKEKNEQ